MPAAVIAAGVDGLVHKVYVCMAVCASLCVCVCVCVCVCFVFVSHARRHVLRRARAIHTVCCVYIHSLHSVYCIDTYCTVYCIYTPIVYATPKSHTHGIAAHSPVRVQSIDALSLVHRTYGMVRSIA